MLGLQGLQQQAHGRIRRIGNRHGFRDGVSRRGHSSWARFVSLANMYQHHSLEEIGAIIERNAQGITAEVMLERITHLCEHLQREDHFDDEQHQRNLPEL